MSAEANKALMRRFVEFINTASAPLAAELIAPDAIFHVPGQPEPLRGPGGYLALVGMMRGGFPDLQWTLEDVVAEQEHVAARYTMRGTHRGAFFGVPPTGRPITVELGSTASPAGSCRRGTGYRHARSDAADRRSAGHVEAQRAMCFPHSF